jgi:beta-N-acetylhexosaminidase
MTPKPIICGIAGTEVTEKEKEFYSEINPLGFAVFKKNLINKDQARSLCKSLREILGREDAPILIDQEGGSVYRMTEPEWPIFYSPLELAKFAYSDIDHALERTKDLVSLNATLMAYHMKEIGVNVNCAPVADLLIENSHHITGTRSSGPNPEITSSLVNSIANGFITNGVQAVIKHMPGQGRANVDSHIKLPVVTDRLEMLEEKDFLVFKNAKNVEWAMTSHILYESLDPSSPVTYSKKAIEYIRNKIGFKGVLISDCLTMQSLKESYGEKASKAIKSGHDLVFFGRCVFSEIEEIAREIPNLSAADFERIQQSFKHIKNPSDGNYEKTLDQYNALMGSIQKEFSEISESRYSEDLKFIMNTIHERNKKTADYSSPLYKA